jgi:hypothetical protein
MTSHETRSTHTTRTKGSASEQNDLKKLKSKYSAKLPTLKVLFSDWSDDDLLFVLEEANGDLDLTIDRISEGKKKKQLRIPFFQNFCFFLSFFLSFLLFIYFYFTPIL